MARSLGRAGHRWRLMRERVLTEEPCCSWCGRPIDRSIPYPHPASPSVDHLIALCNGGDPLDRANLTAMHHRCNLEKEAARRRQHLVTSRQW